MTKAAKLQREYAKSFGFKWCSELKEFRPIADFAKAPSHPDGLNNRCREGTSRYDQRRYLKNLWKNINQHTVNGCYPMQEQHVNGNYANLGIRVADEWIDDRDAFITYIRSALGERPGPGWSMDRINGRGHYEPGNLRWADHKLQALNKVARYEDEQAMHDNIARHVARDTS